jgi:type VI protein secretion system component Hcp
MAASSWSFLMSQSADISTGKLKGGGTAATGSFSFDRTFDRASQPLFDRCARGQHITAATFEAQRAGGGGTAGGVGNPLASEPGSSPAGGDVSRVYFKLVFTDLVITNRQVRWHGDDTGTESISFAFGQVQMSYLQVNTDGTISGSPIQKLYNAKANKAS